MEMSMETFHRHFYFPTFLPKNKNVYGNFPIDICGKECGKIKMSMEMSMETFHRDSLLKTKMSMETSR
jgi:hypothetical protein